VGRYKKKAHNSLVIILSQHLLFLGVKVSV